MTLEETALVARRRLVSHFGLNVTKSPNGDGGIRGCYFVFRTQGRRVALTGPVAALLTVFRRSVARRVAVIHGHRGAYKRQLV